MAATKTKETPKIKDFAETVEGIKGLVKENYLNGVKLALSIWEENLKVLNTQVDQWLNLQQDYTNAVRELYEKFPKEVVTFWNGNSDEVDRFVAFQKGYIESVRSISDKLTKETLSLTKKNVEKAFSLFDDYLNPFRV